MQDILAKRHPLTNSGPKPCYKSCLVLQPVCSSSSCFLQRPFADDKPLVHSLSQHSSFLHLQWFTITTVRQVRVRNSSRWLGKANSCVDIRLKKNLGSALYRARSWHLGLLADLAKALRPCEEALQACEITDAKLA
eukprot:423513-Amphidinium_carterae.1